MGRVTLSAREATTLRLGDRPIRTVAGGRWCVGCLRSPGLPTGDLGDGHATGTIAKDFGAMAPRGWCTTAPGGVLLHLPCLGGRHADRNSHEIDEVRSMVTPGRHPKKEVAEALSRAKAAGHQVDGFRPHRGHRWGVVSCGSCSDSFSIWSTPKDPGRHGQQIDRFTAAHRH